MNGSAVHRLQEFARALRGADAVLVPMDASVADPFRVDATDMLHALCASPMARAALARLAARWAIDAPAVAEPIPGLAVMPLPLPRQAAGGRFAAVTLLSEALDGETIEQLAQSARVDARLARTLLRAGGLCERRGLGRFARLVAALARSEAERLAGVEAGDQLSAAFEELHLLHSLSGEMAVGASPTRFVARTLSELRQTIGCRWTALRFTGPGAQLLGLSNGGVIADGIDTGEARRRLDGTHDIGRALVVGSDLVIAPVRREGEAIGVLAAGERFAGDGAMSNVERTLVETAAGHLAVFLDNARLYRDLDAMFLGSLSALVSAIDAKDPYTRGHSQRVALLSRQIGEAAGLSPRELKDVHIAGLVHDVGKIGVPEHILRKKDRLDDAEFEQIKQHPEIGWRILRDIPQFAPVLGGVRHHHERFDGRGYPHGLAGRDIPLFARIIAIADTFDAMSSTRTYRAARPRAAVLAELRRCAGMQFDPQLLGAFLEVDLSAYDAMNAEHRAGGEDAAKEAA
ncbi:MAG: HD-GYP domain-containing protein [Phycisphaerales bacterium]